MQDFTSGFLAGVVAMLIVAWWLYNIINPRDTTALDGKFIVLSVDNEYPNDPIQKYRYKIASIKNDESGAVFVTTTARYAIGDTLRLMK